MLDPETELSVRCKELVDEWARLDEAYLWKDKKRKVKPTHVFGSKYLTVPVGLDILSLSDSQIESLRHDDIPEASRREYLKGLFEIFRRMPLAASIENRCLTADLKLVRLKEANEKNPFSEGYRKHFVPEINYLPSENDSFQPMRHSVRTPLFTHLSFFTFRNFTFTFFLGCFSSAGCDFHCLCAVYNENRRGEEAARGRLFGW
jgi:hypothetical protein